MQNKRIIIGIILVVTLLAGIVFFFTSKTKDNDSDATDASESYQLPENHNVGNINLTSIRGVSIQMYEDDERSQARYTRGDTWLLDLHQFNSDTMLMSGADYTESFRKVLVDYFDYDENIELEGDLNSTAHHVTYVFNKDENRLIVGIYAMNGNKFVVLDIPRFPLDDDVNEQVSRDIRNFTGWEDKYNLNLYPTMKKVRIKK